MTALDPVGPASEMHAPCFRRVLFGCGAAPLAWLGQLMLSYGVTATVCYPGDHPVSLASRGPLFAALIVFDLCALAMFAGGAFVSWRGWRRVDADKESIRFLTLWGVMSSLWFFVAILFNVIASVMVPPCAG